MKFIITACFLLIALPIEAGTDNPMSALRCGQYIISRGARQSEVQGKCGNPSNIESWEKENVRRDFYKDIPAQSDEQLSQEPLFQREQIRVEEWEYNFGPTRFLYYLRFENGKLIKITIGDYGY
jgi:hypothetical protein